MRNLRRLTLLLPVALILPACVSSERDDATLAPAGQANPYTLGAVTQVTEYPSGFTSVQQRCPPGAEDAAGRPAVQNAEVGGEHPPGAEGGRTGPYARSGCTP